MHRISYLGTDFTVWNGRRTWFWLVVDSKHEGGVIGMAANQAEAIGEARRSVEEMSARCVNEDKGDRSRFEPSAPLPLPIRVSLAAAVWNESLSKLARYLGELCNKKSYRRTMVGRSA